MTPDEDTRPVPREDALFSIRYAVWRTFQYRPRRRDYREADFELWARAVLEQLELAGIRLVRKKPAPWHSTPGRDEG